MTCTFKYILLACSCKVKHLTFSHSSSRLLLCSTIMAPSTARRFEFLVAPFTDVSLWCRKPNLLRMFSLYMPTKSIIPPASIVAIFAKVSLLSRFHSWLSLAYFFMRSFPSLTQLRFIAKYATNFCPSNRVCVLPMKFDK